jgi:hypothetical protein
MFVVPSHLLYIMFNRAEVDMIGNAGSTDGSKISPILLVLYA